MADPASGAHPTPTYLGWRYEVLASDPGPPPHRPAPEDRVRISAEWLSAQRADEARTNRPLYTALAVLGGIALLCVLLWPLRVLPGLFAFGACLGCAAVALPIGVALLQGRRVMRERLRTEERRLDAERSEHERELRERQEEHARAYARWQARKRVYESQPRWYGVRPPDGAQSVVVAGGTDAGWSALLTTLGASLLRVGGDLTVVDLSGRGTAAELCSLVKRSAVIPRVWVLPADLQRMNLGTNLGAGPRARILASLACAFDAKTDTDADETLLLRLFEVLGPQISIAALIGGLRALSTPAGDPGGADPALDLVTPEQRDELRARCGDDRVVRERAWELERHLAPFEGVGRRAEEEPYAQIKVIATDRTLGEASTRAYGTYAVAALSELLELRADRARKAARPWQHTVVVAGADTLPDHELERLAETASSAGAGLVLLFREVAEHARGWLTGEGRFPVLMRQPTTAAAARVLPVLLGSGDVGAAPGGRAPALRIHRLTEVIGEALSDSVADGYVSDTAEDVTAPVSMRNAAASLAPLDLARHVRAATTWGRTTAQAAQIDGSEQPGEAGEGLGGHRIDAHGLATLPPTAMVMPGADGPVLADANPGILVLPTATLSTIDEAPDAPDAAEEDPAAEPAPGHSGRPAPDPPPNLGPPPERLDWRAV
ncbi:hypothetical protein [Streptomonospora litoralis]|uniref:Uncharacterized protein n=1 Tax=Streptomonospora litoralis TaxID=2498135 RepID=A0A4P6PVT2_9ACTN|nr:hypothetical protein [Streptomonospora litoralis]QBI52175.1 hypothetical protein EKD16_01790 [Streptomonospora litoralis]